VKYPVVAFHFRRNITQATVPPKRSVDTVWKDVVWVMIDVSDGIALGMGTLYGAVLMSNKRFT
jgi:hypothetical protein